MLRLRNITIDCRNPTKLAEFWQSATGYSIAFANNWVAELLPTEKGHPHILLLQVPEHKSVKNRMHVDLEAEDREAEVARLESLGATRGETNRWENIIWTVMQDPEGNEFCVAEPHN
jgi:hypothetical protein